MPRIHVLNDTERAQAATTKLLLSKGVVGVCCKSGRHGHVSLVAVCTWTGELFVFDVKKGRDVIFDGGVSRILQSPDVLKVMHDCSAAAADLKNQHGIFLRNVFDTQVAYSVILESEGLPARTTELAHLCDKTSIPQYTPSADWAKLMREDGDAWMRRPLTSDMLQTLSSEVTPLVPHLYTKLLRAIRPEHMTWFERMNSEHQISKQRPVSVARARLARLKEEQKETASCRPSVSLSERQRLLLADTVPLCRNLFLSSAR